MNVPRCPHCGQALRPVELPDAAGWAPLQLVCFNDACGYYVRSWSWMERRYGVRAGYRYRLDPATGTASPIPVWSPAALRDRILDAGVTVERAS